jgi:hypothetical protein
MTYQDFINSVKNERPGRGNPELFLAILEQRLTIQESSDRKTRKAKDCLAKVNRKINEAKKMFDTELEDEIEFWAYEIIDNLTYIKHEEKEPTQSATKEGDTKINWNGDVMKYRNEQWVKIEDITDEDLKMDENYENGHTTIEGLKK